MSDPKLLPCPFCGADHAATTYVRDGRAAVCTCCGALSGNQYHGRSDQPSAEQRAIAAWNRRAPQPTTDARAEALEAEIKRLREALGAIIGVAGDWCEAVDRNSSWDGWDHQFKHMKYKALNEARAALREGGTP